MTDEETRKQHTYPNNTQPHQTSDPNGHDAGQVSEAVRKMKRSVLAKTHRPADSLKREKRHVKEGKSEGKKTFRSAVHAVRLLKPKRVVTPLLLGNINEKYPSTSKIVRIFTSSTFTG